MLLKRLGTSMRACCLAGHWVRCCWSYYRRVRVLLPDRLDRVYLVDRHLDERVGDCVTQLGPFRISPKYLARLTRCRIKVLSLIDLT